MGKTALRYFYCLKNKNYNVATLRFEKNLAKGKSFCQAVRSLEGSVDRKPAPSPPGPVVEAAVVVVVAWAVPPRVQVELHADRVDNGEGRGSISGNYLLGHFEASSGHGLADEPVQDVPGAGLKSLIWLKI